MNIFCFGISHQTANVEVRERFAIPDSALTDSLTRLAQIRSVDESVLLSTCNRTEFYIVSPDSQLAVEPLFHDFYGPIETTESQHLFRLPAIPSIRHLFRVASGLESMVVGETEIFGQLKRAYEIAAKSGTTGRVLNRLFQKAFQVGKHVRSSTAITRGSVSVGSVAVDLAQQIFGNLAGSKIMILGAGETSERTARSFQSRGAKQLFVSNRSYDKAVALAEAMGGRAIRFDDWEQEFRDLDILVSSTAAPHAVVTRAKIEPILRMRRGWPLFIIDLAIPRDVEPTVHQLDDVYVYDLDSLRAIADRTLETRKKEMDMCDSLIKRKRLTNYTADDVGIVVFRLAQAAGVSSAVWLIGRSANPDRIEIRYLRRGMLSRRHVATIDTIAATRGPASLLPMWIQFLRPSATGRIAFSARLLLNSNCG